MRARSQERCRRLPNGLEVTDMSLLIKLLLGVANGLVWAAMLANLFKPQLRIALGPP